MNIIIIPARSGSVRIKNKNLVLLNKKPLIKIILDKIEKTNLPIKIFVSTDSSKILSLVKKYKKITGIKRPKKLAKSSSKIEDALLHVLTKIDINVNKIKWIVTIQPNSPFLTVKTIKKILNLIKKNTKFNVIMTTTEYRADLWIKKKNKYIKRLFPKAPRSSQKRIPLHEENSAVYATRVKHLLSSNKIFDKNVLPVPISKIEGMDINDAIDLKIARSIAHYLI
jgi:CMP-N,N'-diacetyllegionaminic acid synthase